jgi:sodium-dependent phosphate transporter
LTLKQACAIAIFTEFFGAFLLGANTAQTIRKGILTDAEIFRTNPEILMLAMVCALMGSATWVLTATRFGESAELILVTD